MECQICHKNPATIHLTEINEGVRTEMHVCELCATDQGIVVKSQIPLNELLTNLLASQSDEDESAEEAGRSKQCPNCGFTLKQFRKEATLGCPNDYETFEDILLPLIKKAHNGRTIHRGKIPSKTPQNTRKQMELATLRQQLEAAVQSEDYETAATLRDKIDECEKETS